MEKAGVHIVRMFDELCAQKVEFDHKELELKLKLSSANYKKAKLTRLLEELGGEIQRASLEKNVSGGGAGT